MTPDRDPTLITGSPAFERRCWSTSLYRSLLQEAWFRYGMTIEVLHSEVDSAGYDLVLEFGGVIRHVQLEDSRPMPRPRVKRSIWRWRRSRAAAWCGCSTGQEPTVAALSLSYRFFGNGPGEPLPSLQDRKIARHTKANAQGIKAERPALRVLTRADFSAELSLAELMVSLFGEQMIVTTAEAENRPTAEPGQTSSGLDQQR